MYTRVLLSLNHQEICRIGIKNGEWETAGFKVYRVRDLDDVWDYLTLKRIDICVADLALIDVNLADFIERVKTAQSTVRLVAAVEYSELDYAVNCGMGIDEIMIKPISKRSLLNAVNRFRNTIPADSVDSQSPAVIEQRILDLVSDLRFCLHQMYAFEDNRLTNLLKSGTEAELKLEAAKIHEMLINYGDESDKFIIILNSVFVTLMRAALESGCDPKDVIAIVEHNFNAAEDQAWLVEAILGVNRLILENNSVFNEHLIQRVKKYVVKNYARGITLSSVSEHFHINPSYLSRLFLEHTGENYLDFLNRTRVSKAKELLKVSNKKIYEIALEVGFNDAYYFSTWFKRIVGETPSEYRSHAQSPGTVVV